MNAFDILLIEDNQKDLLLAREAINSCQSDINLHAAHTIQQALDFLEKKGTHRRAKTPSLILLNLERSAMGSLELLRMIRRRPKLRYIPILVMSDQTDWQEAKRFYASGANSYLPKPNDLEEFSKIMQWMEMFWLDTCVLPAQNYYAVDAA